SGSGAGRAKRMDALEEVVQVKGFRDDVGDPAAEEVLGEVPDRSADEEDRHLRALAIGAKAVVDIEAAQTRHHDVEDEEVGVPPTNRLHDLPAIWLDDRLVTWLVADRVTEQDGDGLIVLSDHDGSLPRS